MKTKRCSKCYKRKSVKGFYKDKTRKDGHFPTCKKYRNKYMKKRMINDINLKIVHNLRTRIRNALKRNSKSKSTIQLLGCSIKELRKHLERQFKKDMSWKNWSRKGWHIDHIRPCVSFDLSKPEEQKKCFNYTNLRPLWAKENLKREKK